MIKSNIMVSAVKITSFHFQKLYIHLIKIKIKKSFKFLLVGLVRDFVYLQSTKNKMPSAHLEPTNNQLQKFRLIELYF
jgi:hypothetical protein